MATLIERLRVQSEVGFLYQTHARVLAEEAADALEACEKVLADLGDDSCYPDYCARCEASAAITAALAKLRGEP